MPSGFYQNIDDSVFKETLFGLDVNRKGIVREIETQRILTPFISEGIIYVETPEPSPFLRKGSGNSCAVADLAGMAFKPLRIPEQFFKECVCVPVDFNEGNIEASNLVWLLPDEGIPSDIEENARYIPGYTNYVMTEDKRIYSFLSKRFISKFDSSVGKIFRLDSDSGRSQRTIHEDRIFLLTFASYPRDVDRLVVNHRDGNRGNSEITNLEWITQSENLLHSFIRRMTGFTPPDYVYKRKAFDPDRAIYFLKAYEVPLSIVTISWLREIGRNDLIPSNAALPTTKVKRFDARTKKIVVFESLTEAVYSTSTDVGEKVGKKVVHRSMRLDTKKDAPPRGFVHGRYLFRRIEDPFPEFTDRQLQQLHKKERRRVVMYNTDTAEMTFFDTVFHLERATGFTVRVALLRLKKNTQRLPGSNLYIQYEENLGPWKI